MKDINLTETKIDPSKMLKLSKDNDGNQSVVVVKQTFFRKILAFLNVPNYNMRTIYNLLNKSINADKNSIDPEKAKIFSENIEQINTLVNNFNKYNISGIFKPLKGFNISLNTNHLPSAKKTNDSAQTIFTPQSQRQSPFNVSADEVIPVKTASQETLEQLLETEKRSISPELSDEDSGELRSIEKEFNKVYYTQEFSSIDFINQLSPAMWKQLYSSFRVPHFLKSLFITGNMHEKEKPLEALEFFCNRYANDKDMPWNEILERVFKEQVQQKPEQAHEFYKIVNQLTKKNPNILLTLDFTPSTRSPLLQDENFWKMHFDGLTPINAMKKLANISGNLAQINPSLANKIVSLAMDKHDIKNIVEAYFFLIRKESLTYDETNLKRRLDRLVLISPELFLSNGEVKELDVIWKNVSIYDRLKQILTIHQKQSLTDEKLKTLLNIATNGQPHLLISSTLLNSIPQLIESFQTQLLTEGNAEKCAEWFMKLQELYLRNRSDTCKQMILRFIKHLSQQKNTLVLEQMHPVVDKLILQNKDYSSAQAIYNFLSEKLKDPNLPKGYKHTYLIRFHKFFSNVEKLSSQQEFSSVRDNFANYSSEKKELEQEIALMNKDKQNLSHEDTELEKIILDLKMERKVIKQQGMNGIEQHAIIEYFKKIQEKRANSITAELPKYYHSTGIEGLKGILEDRKIEVRNQKLLTGAWTSLRRENVYGPYCIVMTSSIAKDNVPLDHSSNINYKGFQKDITCVVTSQNPPLNQEEFIKFLEKQKTDNENVAHITVPEDEVDHIQSILNEKKMNVKVLAHNVSDRINLIVHQRLPSFSL